MDTVLPNIVLARHLQRLESFVTNITGVNPLSLSLSPQQISTPLHVLLKSDPCLEGDVADDKADP